MDTKKRLEKIEKTIEKLKILNQDYPVIVEGKKDEQSLISIGLNGTIIKIRGPLSKLCEQISKEHKKVILLTDWDKKGGSICRNLKNYLNANSVKYDDRIRAEIALLCKKEIKDVESLFTYIENLKRKCRKRLWDKIKLCID